MCGRYVAATPPDELAGYFGADWPEEVLPPRWNVAPTDEVYGVVELGGRRLLQPFEWGLLPHWAKDAKIAYKLINARADSLATSGAYRQAFATHRCLVPADGFYEWKAVERAGAKPRKQPYYAHRADGEPLAFAGLWSAWRDPKGGPEAPWHHTVSIVTTEANETMAPIHDRMPVILPPGAWPAWLDPANRDTTTLQGLLVPSPPGLLVVHPVSALVSNVRNDGPELVEPVPDPDSPEALGGLFAS